MSISEKAYRRHPRRYVMVRQPADHRAEHHGGVERERHRHEEVAGKHRRGDRAMMNRPVSGTGVDDQVGPAGSGSGGPGCGSPPFMSTTSETVRQRSTMMISSSTPRPPDGP